MKRSYRPIMALFVIGITVLVVVCVARFVFSVNTEQRAQYTQIVTEREFDSLLKSKKQVVAFFYYHADEESKANRGTQKAKIEGLSQVDYEGTIKLYNKIAARGAKHYKDSSFVAINVATKQGENIFDNYSVLDDGTLVELPAILLFHNGKMIDNQMGGVMTEKRVESFIERYFKSK